MALLSEYTQKKIKDKLFSEFPQNYVQGEQNNRRHISWELAAVWEPVHHKSKVARLCSQAKVPSSSEEERIKFLDLSIYHVYQSTTQTSLRLLRFYFDNTADFIGRQVREDVLAEMERSLVLEDAAHTAAEAKQTKNMRHSTKVYCNQKEAEFNQIRIANGASTKPLPFPEASI